MTKSGQTTGENVHNETKVRPTKAADLLQSWWAGFAIKAVALLAVLFILSRTLPAMPVWAVALVWALLSLVPAIAYAYHRVIRKTYNQGQFQRGGTLGRFNSGRVLSMVVAFVVALPLVASLLLEAPKWNATMWVLLLLAIPAYVGISHAVGKLQQSESAPLFQASRTALWSTALVGLALCVVYIPLSQLQPAQPVEGFARAADAFLAMPRPFENSPSHVLSEAGTVLAVLDGFRAYALSQAAAASPGAFVAWSIALNAGALFGFAALLSACAIPLHELKRVFTDLDESSEGIARAPFIGRYVALAALLPALAAVAFVAADAQVGKAAETQEYSLAQEFARKQLSLVVYYMDGKYYDPQAVDALLEKAQAESAALAEEEKAEITALVNASFDARVANVDAYLDWYYRPFADWETLFRTFSGSAEEFLNTQFVEHIEAGIDDSAIDEAREKYAQRAQELKQELESELAQYELTQEYPDWLVVKEDSAESLQSKLEVSFQPAQQLLSPFERLGISAVASVASGLIAKKLVSKLAQKTIFKTVTGRLAGYLTAAGAGGAIGGPGGIIVGIAGTIVADLALQKADEGINRESYKQEILDTIEEQRAETLAALT